MPCLRCRISFLATCAALLLAGCSSGQKPPPPHTAEVGVVTLSAQPVTISNELTGRTNPTISSDVRPQVDGLIQKRLFVEGSIVHAGEQLYQIDPRLYQATLDQDRALLESAQATLFTDQAKADRYRTLSDSQAVSRQTIDDAIAAARAALATVHQYQAAVESARVNLEYTRVLAPITGRISRSSVTPGALVTAAQTNALATIEQLDPIYVDITQSSSDLLKLRRSLARGSVLPTRAAVRLRMEDGSDYPQAGVIEFAEVTVDEEAGTVTLRARFPNPDEILLPGMFVRVEAAQGVIPNGILVPQQGITRDAKGNATALVLDATNKVVQRAVTTAQAIGAAWLVTQGLNAGDRLIVEGTDKAAIGATVKPVAVKVNG